MTDDVDPLDNYDPIVDPRFKHGRSGNPKGRPKGAIGQKTVVQSIANERHTVTEGGTTQRRTTAEIIILVLQRKALGGDLAAKCFLDTLRDQFSPEDANNQGYGCLLVPSTPAGSLEEWANAMGIPIEDIDCTEPI